MSHDHYSSVLNITSTFDDQVIEAVDQRLVTEIAVPPSDEEFSKAMS